MKKYLNFLNITFFLITFVISYYILHTSYNNENYTGKLKIIDTTITIIFPGENYLKTINNLTEKMKVIENYCGNIILSDLDKYAYFNNLRDNYVKIYLNIFDQSNFNPTSKNIIDNSKLSNVDNVKIIFNFDKSLELNEMEEYKNKILDFYNKYTIHIKKDYSEKLSNIYDDYEFRSSIIKKDLKINTGLFKKCNNETVSEFITNYQLAINFLETETKNIEKNTIEFKYTNTEDINNFQHLTTATIIVLCLIFSFFLAVILRLILNVIKF